MVSKNGFKTTEARSTLMSNIKCKNTKTEVLFRKALWAYGIRYRVNNNSLFGKPDISIKKYKLVIFIDGAFWHGYNWEQKKKKLAANRGYWINKIERNILRDINVNSYYINQGWTLFRFWEHDVIKNVGSCVHQVGIEIAVKEKQLLID
ncbi:very short patch repair endonuclease [Niastella yeongjuensis]|uniref:Very short patch repair endonuclease n=1 Tax=Niastella yeongjuensis TaxID=354355 RepID=A0A1V9ETW8_9BACT|nr:very short patch repair endonuclease [Niastella yeongjuensis]OQP49285.1 very short patch repair endonuclease [Niastella yeongjuensis]SEP42998.1 T/G mismatch-specific endonuclease [Niastella yeongjuensis]